MQEVKNNEHVELRREATFFRPTQSIKSLRAEFKMMRRLHNLEELCPNLEHLHLTDKLHYAKIAPAYVGESWIKLE